MSKKKKNIYVVISADDKRVSPKKIFGAFDYDEAGLKLANEFIKKKKNSKLVIKKI
jgi:hypothetical protein